MFEAKGNFKRTEMRVFDKAFKMEDGYPLDFSNRTISEYFEDEFAIDFYDQRFEINGSSKAKILRTILHTESVAVVGKVLRGLWDYSSTLPPAYQEDDPNSEAALKARYFEAIDRVKNNQGIPKLDAIEKFEKSETLDELVLAIERDIVADRPSAALDRLHTYCMKKFRSMLEASGHTVTENDALHSRVGKYAKVLEAKSVHSEMSIAIIKSSISIFEKFNHVRNNQTFAHDNILVAKSEARFIFDSVSAILRFIKSINRNFGS